MNEVIVLELPKDSQAFSALVMKERNDIIQAEGTVQIQIKYIMEGERCVGKEFTIRTGRHSVCHACGGTGRSRMGLCPCVVCE